MASETVWQFIASQAVDKFFPDELATARIRDPLWMLARQWQLKEFDGDDAGSAIQVRYLASQAAVNRYASGTAALLGMAAQRGFDEHAQPMESAVESEGVALGIRGSVQFGLRFEAMLCDAQAALRLSAAQLTSLIMSFRTAFPLAANTVPYDARAIALSSLAAGAVTDGWALYQLAAATPASPKIPPGAAQVVSAFVVWCSSIYITPEAATAWDSERLTYSFTAGAAETRSTVAMKGPDFPGGRLDWYDYDADHLRDSAAPGGATAKSVSTSAEPRQPSATDDTPIPTGAGREPPHTASEGLAPTIVAGSALPTHLRFTGMPEPRYWNFEDGILNLGAVAPNVTDLSTNLVLEYAFVYSNDWFVLSMLTPVGSLTTVAGVVVTDTFGIRTLIEAADGRTTGPSGTLPWTMFTMSGTTGQLDTVLLPPTLADVQDGSPLEEVWFARDDMAAMAWAEEHILQGPMDVGVDAYEDVLRRGQSPPPATSDSSTANLAYVLGTSVPANWIPALSIPGDALCRMRRGVMTPLDPATGAPTPIYPRGFVLCQGQPQASPPPMLLVRDSAIPPTGVQVTRYFRRARWIDGSTACWIGRDVTAGAGQALSGLAFDVLQPVGPPTS